MRSALYSVNRSLQEHRFPCLSLRRGISGGNVYVCKHVPCTYNPRPIWKWINCWKIGSLVAWMSGIFSAGWRSHGRVWDLIPMRYRSLFERSEWRNANSGIKARKIIQRYCKDDYYSTLRTQVAPMDAWQHLFLVIHLNKRTKCYLSPCLCFVRVLKVYVNCRLE